MELFKQQKLENVTINNSIVMQAAGNLVLDKEFYSELSASHQNLKLFNRLIREKITLCKGYILNKDINKLRKIINTIFNYGFNGIDNEQIQILYFYRFVSAILEKNNDCMEDCIDNLQNRYREEAEILSNFQKETYHMAFDDYSNLSIEAQMVILDISFEEGLYAYIKELYLENAKENKEVSDILKFYCGLSMLNLHQFQDAYYILGCVNQLEKEAQIHLLRTLSLAQIEMIKYDRERTNGKELEKIFHELGKIRKKDVNVLSGCELAMAITELQIAIWLSPDSFVEILESYEIDIQKDSSVQFLLGLYYESCNEIGKAIDIYHNGDWKNSGDFLFRLLLCNMILGKYDEALQVYDSAYEISKTAQSTGIWLSAVKQQSINKYYMAIREKTEMFKHNVEDIFYIILSVDNEKGLFDDLFLNVILNKFDLIKESNFQIRIGYANILLRFEYAELCLKLIDSLDNAISLDERVIFDFYESLYKYKSDEIQASSQKFPTGKVASYLENKVKICDWFINHNIRNDLFLKEKINCLFLQKKIVSTLSCTKQLYEITHEEDVATNMIALLLESETSSKSDYEYCIQALRDTENPRCLIALAGAYKRIGKIKEANFYSYKAIFLLNGEDDFEIYNGFLGLQNEMMYDHQHSTIDFNEVVGNTVVTLSAVGKHEESCTEIIESVCLDSELELEEMVSNNYSMNVKHFCSKNPKYLRLQNKKKKQLITMDGKEFIIEEIINREVYAFRYVLNKCIQNPDKCNIVTLSVKSDSIESIWEQIRQITHKYSGSENNIIDKNERRDVRLDLYHFKNNNIGIPIDTLVQKNYDNYIDVIRLLLYGKNQALYAGDINIDKITDNKIVVTLSTLVILCQIGKLDLLKGLENDIIIPLSLIEFLHIRVKKSIEMQAISPGTLIEMPDGSPAMLSFDETVVDMWNAIYEFCLRFEKIEITDQERLEFSTIEGVSSEVLFSSLEIGKMQMDCMILAKQRGAIYLCDDLFFRQIATVAGIKNTNLTSLIFLLDDRQMATKICMVLSKTNYIFVPCICGNMEEAREIWENLLSSDRKRKYYYPMLKYLRLNIGDYMEK